MATVRGKYSSFVGTLQDLRCEVMQTVLLQMRLYALYKRSNKILGLMAICFLAEVSADFYTYISFDSTAQGQLEHFLCGKYLITFDSYKSTVIRGLHMCSNTLPGMGSLYRVFYSCLRVDDILFERLDRLSAF